MVINQQVILMAPISAKLIVVNSKIHRNLPSITFKMQNLTFSDFLQDSLVNPLINYYYFFVLALTNAFLNFCFSIFFFFTISRFESLFYSFCF